MFNLDVFIKLDAEYIALPPLLRFSANITVVGESANKVGRKNNGS
jgi:hypothetical protein